MARKRPAEELTVEELRQLLVEKRRYERQARLDHYRRTGRLVSAEIAPIYEPSNPDQKKRTDVDEDETPRQKRRVRRPWLDKVLLAVEVIAVLGLIFVLFNGINLVRNLNNEVASAIKLSALTPTPLVVAVVLPSGHTPPNASGGGAPNEQEIPEHLRPLVQSLANLPLPTSSPEQTVRIQVPSINIDSPVIQGDAWEQLKKGVGQSLGSPNPGQKGNIVLSAHNDIYGAIFQNLDRLRPGDQIILFTSQRTFTYIVRQTQIVEPTRVDVMAQTQEAIITLISCYPYMVDNQRIVVVADLQQ